MACSGYFSKNTTELRAARTFGKRDGLGVQWHGPVTNGETSVDLALNTDDAQALLTPHHLENERSSGSPLETDPVLLSHIVTKTVPPGTPHLRPPEPS